jgi:antitoxin PrlF
MGVARGRMPTSAAPLAEASANPWQGGELRGEGGRSVRDSQNGIGALPRGQAGFLLQCRITGKQKNCYTDPVQAKATINDRGVITIPAAMRQALGLKPNDEVLIEATEQGLLIRPVLSVPLEIYTEKRIAEFARDDKAIGKLLPKKRS